jgi:uncharacterized protein Yka (UPF0111/DUF47 family)
MSDLVIELEEVVDMVRGLSPLDKVRLVEEVMALLGEDLAQPQPAPKRSMYGIWKDVHITEEDIDEIRQEMWPNFPREDTT